MMPTAQGAVNANTSNTTMWGGAYEARNSLATHHRATHRRAPTTVWPVRRIAARRMDYPPIVILIAVLVAWAGWLWHDRCRWW